MARPFPFFRLPRELRDEVYRYLGGEDVTCAIKVPCDEPKDDQKNQASIIVRAVASHQPLPQLLLVSHAFEHEYKTELRRHSAVRVCKPHERELVFGSQRLIKHGPAHRCFRHARKLEVRLEDKLDESSPVLDESVRIVRAFAPFMDSLQSVDCMFTFPLTGHECDAAIRDYDRGFSDIYAGDVVSPMLRNILKPNGSHCLNKTAGVPVTNHLYLKAQLLGVQRPFRPTFADFERFPSFHRYLPEEEVRYLIEGSRLNQITYKATLSNDKYHFLGLELTIHEPTAVARDFDEILNEAELEFEKLALSHDVAYEYGFDGQNFEFRR
ncbi:hypothetical protein PRZ48_009579 [Zasmidium cellare]|uniref:Uncharacterized protein n=1 Tax=Zasmidium cellare TaxID=395010 RepID=A0ABR0EC44_ZASCE|nr:hypothetical protein PRZ48_009579 [Zasmidium cellare]